MPKPEKQKEAKKLRLKGESFKTIAKKLKVSPASIHNWCREIKLTLEQEERLKKKSFDALQKGRKKANENQKIKRLAEIEKFKKEGIADISKISEREFFLVGVALYWSEGFKKDSRLGFANSDPNMIKFFLYWLIKICGVPKESIRLRVGLNISHKNRIKEVENYWSKLTQIPISQFQKTFFQNFKWKKEFKNPENYFGVLRIRANQQRQLFRKIHGWVEGLKLNATG